MKTLDVILNELHRQAREDPRLYINDSNPYGLDIAGHINLAALAAALDAPRPPPPVLCGGYIGPASAFPGATYNVEVAA